MPSPRNVGSARVRTRLQGAYEYDRANGYPDSIYVDESIKDYIVSLVISTREPGKIDGNLLPYIRCGASPRATINLTLASKANAFIQGRGYVTPTDVKKVAPEILRHRVLLTYEAEAEQITTDQLVSQILEGVPVP